MNTKRMLIVLMSVLAMAAASAAPAGEQIVKRDCVQCHDIEGPAPSTLEGMWSRKGPDLFYAGNKYREEWLTRWLQDPARIRPAGMFFANHVAHVGGRDILMTDGLIEHPALDGDDAARVAAWLMTLKARSELIKPGDYQPGTIALSMGEMIFDRFRGCIGCHEIEPGFGGMSGPEVYTAGARLQPDFMISYLRNPQAWDPRTFMPPRKLNDNDLQRLVHYLRALSEEVAQ